MRKFTSAVLLLFLSCTFLASSLRAQSRARRVNQTPAKTTPSNPSPERTPAAPAKSAPEEVGADDVVRVNTTLVTVPVSVMDRDGKYIPDLRREDFRLYEDGVEQEIAYFASVEKPFTVVLMLDTSGSTHFRLDEIQDAAIAFVDQLREDDRVMVVSFDDSVRVLTEPTSDRARLREAIRRTHSGDGTRLYDAVDMVINDKLNRIQGRKAIVLFTDGVDTTSRRATYASTVRDAEELDALIYPVQYDTYRDVNSSGPTSPLPPIIFRWPFPVPNRYPLPIPGGGSSSGGRGTSRRDYERADAYLQDLANKTGARLYRAERTRNLEQTFALVAEELRRQYSLGYYPKNTARAGERRQIRVRVTQPDLVVRSRDSYIYDSSGKIAGQKLTSN
jgi:VWFA-related protein